MLDLSAINVTYFDVKLPDETIINIKTPSLRMKNEIVELPSKLQYMNDSQQEKVLSELVSRILSRNTDNRQFTVEQVNNWFPEPVQNYIVNEYAIFIKNISNQKN